MTVRGIEAIKLKLPPTSDKIDINVRVERANTSSIAMSSVERYREEWNQLLSHLEDNFEYIKDRAFNGALKVSKFRSVHWALLLRVLSNDYPTWVQQRQQQRTRYERLKQEFIKNPHDVEGCDDNPLSQSKQSIWNQYFSDQELFSIIKQDVVRTFPGVDFFRKPVIQTAMSNILFYYAREHPYLCYRQGMHEILAPILFVMFSDHQSLLHFKEIAKTEISEVLLDVLDPDYLEADCYSIFSRLMASIESYYRISNIAPAQGCPCQDQDQDQTELQNYNGMSTEAEVIGQLNSIREKILAKEDLHLHNCLMELDIPLHIFGIRWLRLLFGREFPLLDLLMLWDAIFADSDHFDLPNYILVSMLISIRDKLLLNDYTTCLTFLMRYPNNIDVNIVLRHALHMKMPKKFDRPPNAFTYFTMNSNAPVRTSKLLGPRRNSQTISRTNHKLESREAAPKVGAAATMQSKHRERSNSLSNATSMEKQIIALQAKNAADSAVLARLRLSPDSDHLIMDGYSDNSPELLRLELKNAQTVITIARTKLQKYLHTIRSHVTTKSSEELLQAIDGIDELCNFLNVKFMFPINSSAAAPIDQALEADEMQRKVMAPINCKKVKACHQQHADYSVDSDNGADKITSCYDKRVINCDATAPAAASTAYEKPDNGFVFNSHRFLGNLKEIELIPIISDEKAVHHSSLQLYESEKSKIERAENSTEK